MLKTNFISTLIPCFSRFVSADVRKKMFKSNPGSSELYDRLYQEVMSLPDTDVIPEITDIVVSVNEGFVSNCIKNSTGLILFVEYGNIRLDFDGYGTQQADLSVTVAQSYNAGKMDVIREAVLMEECLEKLNRILTRLHEEQRSLDWANPLIKQIKFPATIYSVEPQKFYDRCGFAAMFKREDPDND